jgi:hypothetical protein
VRPVMRHRLTPFQRSRFDECLSLHNRLPSSSGVFFFTRNIQGCSHASSSHFYWYKSRRGLIVQLLYCGLIVFWRQVSIAHCDAD